MVVVCNCAKFRRATEIQNDQNLTLVFFLKSMNKVADVSAMLVSCNVSKNDRRYSKLFNFFFTFLFSWFFKRIVSSFFF